MAVLGVAVSCARTKRGHKKGTWLIDLRGICVWNDYFAYLFKTGFATRSGHAVKAERRSLLRFVSGRSASVRTCRSMVSRSSAYLYGVGIQLPAKSYVMSRVVLIVAEHR